jgi:glutamate racemase
MRVLVFDSGVGGLSVVDAIVGANVPCTLDYLADTAWLPYGEKTGAEILARTPDLIHSLATAWGANAIIVACNTASTIVLPALRALSATPVIGVVPPIKPAAQITRTGVIGVLATPATIRRAYTGDLIDEFARGIDVITVGSTDLVTEAERIAAGHAPQDGLIAREIAPLFDRRAPAPVDVVALACTHFPLLASHMQRLCAWPVTWLDSGQAIARRLATILTLDNPGLARCDRAAFTGDEAGARAWPAFAHRGFGQHYWLDSKFAPARLT